MMGSEKILVVDDEPHIREALQAALESAGYSVEVAENGKEGVEKCRAWRPTLVILDVRMPVMDGHLASIEIKYDEQLKNTKVVFLTANADEDSRSQGLGHGAETYLTKPFKVEHLLERIDAILHPHGSTKTASGSTVSPEKVVPALDPQARQRYLESLKKKFGG